MDKEVGRTTLWYNTSCLQSSRRGSCLLHKSSQLFYALKHICPSSSPHPNGHGDDLDDLGGLFLY